MDPVTAPQGWALAVFFAGLVGIFWPLWWPPFVRWRKIDEEILKASFPRSRGGGLLLSVMLTIIGYQTAPTPWQAMLWGIFAVLFILWFFGMWHHDYRRSLPRVAGHIDYLTYAPRSDTDPHKLVLTRLVFTNPPAGPSSYAGSVRRVQLFLGKTQRIGEATFAGDELKEYPHMNATPQDVVVHNKSGLVNLASTTEVKPDGMVSVFAFGRVDDPNVTEEQLAQIRIHFENQRKQSIWSEEVGWPQVHRGRFEGNIQTE
jgi:hypothetical protein